MGKSRKNERGHTIKTFNLLNLGAGVQSTVLALMACRGELELHPDHIMFSDTGNESKATYKHIEFLSGEFEKADIPFTIVKTPGIYEDLMSVMDEGVREDSKLSDLRNKVGNPPLFIKYHSKVKEIEVLGGRKYNPNILLRTCTSYYKVDPIYKELRKVLGMGYRERYQRNWECNKMLGISADEVYRVKESKHKWENNVYPLIDIGFTRNDCYNWLIKNGYSIPPKSSCVICPFKSDRDFARIKEEEPDEFEKACKLDDALREKTLPGTSNGIVYLHRSGKPLRDVEFKTKEDSLDMFINECEGYCGI
jgi:hypothetical protein